MIDVIDAIESLYYLVPNIFQAPNNNRNKYDFQQYFPINFCKYIYTNSVLNMW